MVRIIPWKLPDVEGGSVGGYTPAPTPEPLTNYPYDLDDFAITLVQSAMVSKSSVYSNAINNNKPVGTPQSDQGYYVFDIVTASVSGVKILDATEVSSIILSGSATGTATVTFYTNSAGTSDTSYTSTFTGAEFAIDLSTCFGNNSSAQYFCDNNPSSNNDAFEYKNYYGVKSADFSSLELTIDNITVFNSNGIALQVWEPGE